VFSAAGNSPCCLELLHKRTTTTIRGRRSRVVVLRRSRTTPAVQCSQQEQQFLQSVDSLPAAQWLEETEAGITKRDHLDHYSQQKLVVEKHWREFFSDPSQWWDNRPARVVKKNARFPDFQHKKTLHPLWLNCKHNPRWVQVKLAALAPGSVQLSIDAWNAKLGRYVKSGQCGQAIELFQQMERQCMTPSTFTFVTVLKACAKLGLLQEGKRIHAQILQKGCESDIFVSTSLVDMYTKCGSLEDACKVFDRMSSHDVVSWTAMISGHVKHGQAQKALELYHQMEEEEAVTPNSVSFVGVLNACADLLAIDEGRRVHEQIIHNGCELNVYVGCSLINMYAKCGSIADAQRVFDGIPARNLVSWNAMIMAYVKCGQDQQALKLYQQMQREGMQPDAFTFVGVLNACAGILALKEGRCVHEQIIQSGCESNLFVGCSLVDMYAKCRSLEEAQRVFNRMPRHNVVSWNAIILGHVKSQQAQQALELYKRMQSEGVQPDSVTFVGVLNACASVMALGEGRLAHEQIIQSNCESNVFVVSSLVDMYAKCGSLEDAQKVFNRMPRHNVVSWNAMILGHVKCGQGQEALELYQKMQGEEGVQPDPVTFVGVLNACASITALEEGRSIHEQIVQSSCNADVCVSNALIDMYTKCGSPEDALRVFNTMPIQGVVAWNTMILGYVKCGQGQKALELYQEMQQAGVKPCPVTFVGLLNACASVVALEEGRCIHEEIIECGCELSVFVGSSLIDMYAKCGSLEDAQRVFNEMPTRDVFSWTALLGGYAMHGQATEALIHFEEMCNEGVAMDRVAFIALLSACSHGGLVYEGLLYFESMGSVYGISATVEHCACMVDLLGRAGHLQEAEDFIDTMSCEPNGSIWMALLAACRVHCNWEMGERAASQILDLEPGNAPVYGLQPSLFAAGGKWGLKENVQLLRNEKGGVNIQSGPCLKEVSN
jgi:pentatricopeptide repeat protein